MDGGGGINGGTLAAVFNLAESGQLEMTRDPFLLDPDPYTRSTYFARLETDLISFRIALRKCAAVVPLGLERKSSTPRTATWPRYVRR